MTTSTCPVENDLKLYRMGKLPEAKSIEMDRHVLGCAACATRLGTLPADDPLVTALRAQKGRPQLRNPVVDGIRKETRTQPLPVLAAVPVAVAVPVAATPKMKTPLQLDKRYLIAGGGGTLLLLLIVVLAFSGKKKEKEEEKPSPLRDDKSVRAKAPPKSFRHEAPSPLVLNEPNDKAFKETWVTKPAMVDGVNSWNIECRLATWPYPARLEVTEDEQLLVQYVPPNGPSWWYRFDPNTFGLSEGPYKGQYQAVAVNERMAARVDGNGVHLWEQGGEKEWKTLVSSGPFFVPSFSPDHRMLVVFDDTGNSTAKELTFHDLASDDKKVHCTLTDMVVTPKVHAWSPDGKTLAVSVGRGIACFEAPWEKPSRTIPRSSLVSALAWSPGGKFLATTEADQHIRILDFKSGEPLMELKDWKAASAQFVPVWSPDGKELAFGTDESKVVVYNPEAKKATFSFAGHKRPLTALAYYGDGRTLVSASRGGLRFWDLSKNAYRGSLLCFGIGEWVTLAPNGYYRTSVHPNVERRLLYKVREENDRAREFYVEEFHTLYGRQNVPEQVRLVGE